MNKMNISEEKISKLRRSQKVLVFTGAGISKESGIPTFRGDDGLWKKFSPQELANFDSFYENPALVSEWYQHRRDIIEDVEPNPAHNALVEMEKYYSDFTITTQNVDDLHNRAGSREVLELHGNIMRNYCIECGKEFSPSQFQKLYSQNEDHISRCDQCHGLIRPDVVWFGEQLPQKALQKSFDKARKCDLCFSIGTSAQIRPAADIPRIAAQNGAFLVEINPNKTSLSSQTNLSLKGKAGELLPALVDIIKKENGS